MTGKNHCNALGVGQVEKIAHFFHLLILILNKKKEVICSLIVNANKQDHSE